MVEVFTNRETAIIIWISLFTIYAFYEKSIRGSIFGVIKSALNKYILLYFVSYLVYILAFICMFYHFKLWDKDNLKDSLIWFVFSGLPIGFILTNKTLERGFWRKLVLENLKLILLLEFIINSFTFSLPVEFFILIPFVTMITLLNAFCKHKNEYKLVEKLTNTIITVFGFIIISYSCYRAITEIQLIENINTLRSIFLPVVFSVVSVPYMYTLKLYIEYENNVITRRYNELPRKSDKFKTQ